MKMGGMQQHQHEEMPKDDPGVGLDEKIGFMDIAAINEKVLAGIESENSDSIEHLLEVDSRARTMAGSFISGWKQ